MEPTRQERAENHNGQDDLTELHLVNSTSGESSPQSRLLRENFEKILDALPFYVLLVDTNHIIHYANKAVRASFGLTLEEITGQFCPKVIHHTDKPYPGCPVQDAINGGPFEKEHYATELGRWLLTSAFPTGCKTEDDLELYFHTVRDITEQKATQAAVIESERKYRTLFEEITDIIFIMAPDGTLLDINQSGCDFLGLKSRDDITRLNMFRDMHLQKGDWDSFREALERHGGVSDVELSLRKGSGETAILSTSASVERDGAGKPVIVRGIMRDLTRSRELELQSTTDDLTSLYNHGFFQTYLVNKVRHMQAGSDKHLTVLFLDIDDFKQYNDTFGHQEGDYVLQKVSQAIMKAARGEDVASRYGGEEFTLILTCDFETAKVVAERLRATIEDLCSTFADPRIKRNITVSVGLATLDERSDTAAKVVKLADARMYEAKKRGKNSVFSGDVDLSDDEGLHSHLT